MKRPILLFSLFVFSLSFSQPFIPILDEEYEWSQDFEYYFDPWYYVISSDIIVNGTVEYNGITYKLLQDSYLGTCQVVREENGILYYYEPSEDLEFPVLDFNLDVGDTFELPLVFFYQCGWENIMMGSTRTVTNVEYINIANAERKVITLDFYGMQEVWYEGIGSTWGIVPFQGIHETIRLVCFTTGGETTYFNGATSCDNTMSVEERWKDLIYLTPNPVTSTSILRIPSELPVDRLVCYDLNGRVISATEVLNGNPLIDAAKFDAGVYFYKLYSDEIVIKTEKFIVK